MKIKNRKFTGFEAVAAVVGILTFLSLLLLLETWVVMLLIGGVSHVVGWDFFPSFWGSMVITLALNVIGGFFKSN